MLSISLELNNQIYEPALAIIESCCLGHGSAGYTNPNIFRHLTHTHSCRLHIWGNFISLDQNLNAAHLGCIRQHGLTFVVVIQNLIGFVMKVQKCCVPQFVSRMQGFLNDAMSLWCVWCVRLDLIEQVVPSYEYGELILKNYKSNLSQNRPTSFCLGDNQSPRDILSSKAVVYSEVLHSHVHKLWPCLLYTLPELQISNNACIDLVVDIMKLSSGLIVRYLFQESYDSDCKRIWSHKEGLWTVFQELGL